MASIALEEKINKIRLRNEEIKRRYEEVEADKKNAAKLDALIEPIPPEDWPERKEPPEFSASSSKHTNKPKLSVRKHNDQPAHYNTGSGEGKKTRTFADGQGPPPDPKYNFLADSEREEHAEEIPRDTDRNRGRNKTPRGGFKRRGSGRDWHAKDHWNQQGSPGDKSHPDYEAWRAERNRIDEARISRQRTAEGNWRREWDNDKIHLANEVTKRDNRVTMGDVVTRQEHSENDQYYRSPRTPTSRISHNPNSREFHQGSAVFSDPIKSYSSVGEPEKRVVIATDKSIKVLLNSHGSTPPKTSTPMMSVKVSSPNIAGTGRVGPRQRPRVMYSSQSEADVAIHEISTLSRQKSIDESTRIRHFDQTHKPFAPKSPHHQRKRDTDGKSTYPARKDNERVEITMKSYAARKENERAEITMKSYAARKENERAEITMKALKKDSQKSPHPSRRGNSSNYPPKSPRAQRRSGDSNDFTKLSAQHENISENNVCLVMESSKESKKVDIGDTFEASVAAKDHKSDQLLDGIESDKDNDHSAQLEDETLVVTAENCILSGENDNVVLEEAQLETPASSAGEFVRESLENGGNTEEKKEMRDVIDTHDEKANNSMDVESSDIQAIDCSANSGLTSNDSGFIELPSNDSIHNISDHMEMIEVTKNHSESMPSTSKAGQDDSIIENHVEPEIIIANVDDAVSSSKDLETTFGSSQLDGTSAETSKGSRDDGKAEIIERKPQEKDPSTEKPAENLQNLKSSNDKSATVSMSPEIVVQEPAIVEKISDTGNVKILEFQSEGKDSLAQKTVESTQNLNSSNVETAIVSMSPKIVAQQAAVVKEAEIMELETQERDVVIKNAANGQDVKSLNNESPITSMGPKIVAQENADKSAVLETANDTGNVESLKLESQEKHTVTEKVTEDTQDVKSPNDKSTIDSMSPKIRAQGNVDEAAVLEKSSIPDHEKDEISDKPQT